MGGKGGALEGGNPLPQAVGAEEEDPIVTVSCSFSVLQCPLRMAPAAPPWDQNSTGLMAGGRGRLGCYPLPLGRRAMIKYPEGLRVAWVPQPFGVSIARLGWPHPLVMPNMEQTQTEQEDLMKINPLKDTYIKNTNIPSLDPSAWLPAPLLMGEFSKGFLRPSFVVLRREGEAGA